MGRDHSRHLGVDVIATYDINIVDISYIICLISNMAPGDKTSVITKSTFRT
jgi:hypothetical protein